MIERLSETAARARRIEASSADALPRCTVLIDGREARQPLAGAVVEAAFKVNDRYLVFLTDDVPFEEALRIHLLDADLALLDTAWLGWIYSTGTFEVLECVQPGSVHFRFFGEADWVAVVHDAPVGRLPFVGEARGVHRAFGIARHFTIEHSPRRVQGA